MPTHRNKRKVKLRIGGKVKLKGVLPIDRLQNKRISKIERSLAEKDGWIDSYYTETTMNRTPQEVSRGTQDSAGASGDTEFFIMQQETDGSDMDHRRVGLSIKAKRIKAHIVISGRGSSGGYPPDEGDESGSNQVRLLGVCYATLADYNEGLAEVLQYSETTNDAKPAQAIETFFKKQSTTKWNVWFDKKFSVPYTTQTSRVNINYKVPASRSKMVYPNDQSSAPDTNIYVLYAMTGVRKNDHNRLTLQAWYRCTYEK